MRWTGSRTVGADTPDVTSGLSSVSWAGCNIRGVVSAPVPVRDWWRGYRLGGGGWVRGLTLVSCQRGGEMLRCLHLLKEKGRSLELELF